MPRRKLTAIEQKKLKEARDWIREHDQLEADGCYAPTAGHNARVRIGALVEIIDRLAYSEHGRKEG